MYNMASIYEKQSTTFNCGATAIINARIHDKHYVSKLQRRTINNICNARKPHRDGFNGTKPHNLAKVIKRYWPCHKHVKGCYRVSRALSSNTYNKYIMLFAFRSIKNKIYYHYAFIYKLNDEYHFQNCNDWPTIHHWGIYRQYITIRKRYCGHTIPQLWCL